MLCESHNNWTYIQTVGSHKILISNSVTNNAVHVYGMPDYIKKNDIDILVNSILKMLIHHSVTPVLLLHYKLCSYIMETFLCRLGNLRKVILYNNFNTLFLFAEKINIIFFLNIC